MYQISKLSTVHGQILRHLKNVWQPYRQPHRHRSPPILWASFHEAKKPKVTFMVGAKGPGEVMDPKSFWFVSTLFLVDKTTHSWDKTILRFALANPRSRLWARLEVNVILWVQHPMDSHLFHFMSIGLFILRYGYSFHKFGQELGQGLSSWSYTSTANMF